MTDAATKSKAGDRVFILPPHPWNGHAGELIAYETYGLGWKGWRVKLDGNCGECYAKPEEMMMNQPRIEKITFMSRKRVKR